MHARCGLAQLPNEYFWNYCDRVHAASPDEYFGAIRECYASEPHWDARAYSHLIAIKFRGYVTLNYDGQLPSAFRLQHPDDYGELFSVYPSRPGQMTAQPADFGHKDRLVAVHGYCDPQNPRWAEEVILRGDDYNNHYFNSGTNHFLFNWWKNLLVSHPCIFIGTSLMEPGLCKVVEGLMNDKNDRFLQHDHIHLIDSERLPTAPHYKPAGKTFNIWRRICFDRIDPRYTGLLNVLSPFSGIPVENPSPNTPAPRLITFTTAFNF